MWAVQTMIASFANSEGWTATADLHSQRRAPLISGAMAVRPWENHRHQGHEDPAITAATPGFATTV
jgi:hypothetical protein